MPTDPVEMKGVKEYGCNSPVLLQKHENGRLIICATVEAKYGLCEIDAVDLVDWLARNRPMLLSVIQS